jgi:hypothetical protein
MLPGVPVRGLVATTDMPAVAANTKMHPFVAGLEAILATEGARRDVANGIEMRASLPRRRDHLLLHPGMLSIRNPRAN